MLNFSYMQGGYQIKRLKDFKIDDRTPRPAIKVMPMQFDDDEAIRRIMMHDA